MAKEEIAKQPEGGENIGKCTDRLPTKKERAPDHGSDPDSDSKSYMLNEAAFIRAIGYK